MENAPKALADLGIAGNGSDSSSPSRIPRGSITSSFARYAPAIRGACWACRPRGTNPRLIARVSCANLARCLPNSASTCRKEPRFAFGISTAEVRYLIVPPRPRGTEAMSETEGSRRSSPAIR